MKNNVGFDKALKAVKEGKTIQRSGWNGKGMYLFMAKDDVSYPVPSHADSGFRFLPFLVMKTVDNGMVPWLASQTDILANDWSILD